MKIEQLTDVQYEILVRMDIDWCYPFSHFVCNGLMTEEGEVAGSGYARKYRANNEIDKLIEDWEENNLPTYEEAMVLKEQKHD